MSHATPHWLDVTVLCHMPHGNLGLRGPGLTFMSCMFRSRLDVKCIVNLAWLLCGEVAEFACRY